MLSHTRTHVRADRATVTHRRRHTRGGHGSVCTHTYSPVRRAGRRAQNLSGCHGDLVSFRWSMEAVWLPGGTEQRRSHDQHASHHAPRPSSHSFSAMSNFFMSNFTKRSPVCVYLNPLLIQKSHHQPSGQSGLSEPGAGGAEAEVPPDNPGWGCWASHTSPPHLYQ